jgi:transposase
MPLPPDLRASRDDYLAWFVIEAVKELHLELFYAAPLRRPWRRRHDPKMMVTLFAYAYAVGERSSRGLEGRCREDVAFRVICANQVPNRATIARRRSATKRRWPIPSAILGFGGKAGVVDISVIAADGTKLAAEAFDGAILSYEQIAAERGERLLTMRRSRAAQT